MNGGLFAYGLDEYVRVLAELGQPGFRGRQLAAWVWQRGVDGYDEMTDLPTALRERLATELPFLRGRIVARQESVDGTRKYVVAFADGVTVECVGIPATRGGARLSVCVSSQAGCALGCVFCATGRGGFVRDLLPGEIAEQVRVVGADFGQRVSSVVVMGQGEPLLNYDATLAGLRIVNSVEGLGIGARHITLSTAGIIAGIKRLAAEPEQFTLAVSLHSAVQTRRDELMPGLRGQSLERLHTALADYYRLSGRRPSLEYALIAGVSDTDEEVTALAQFAQELGAHVNLIPLNEVEGTTQDMHGVGRARAREVCVRLQQAGVEVSVRAERGADIAAACGQLTQRLE